MQPEYASKVRRSPCLSIDKYPILSIKEYIWATTSQIY